MALSGTAMAATINVNRIAASASGSVMAARKADAPRRNASAKTVANGRPMASASQASATAIKIQADADGPLRRHPSHRWPLRAMRQLDEVHRQQRREGEDQHGQRRPTAAPA